MSKGFSPSPIHLPHRLDQICEQIVRRAMNGASFTKPQLLVLDTLQARGTLTQAQIIEATGIDKSTLGEMLNRLEAAGHVAREKREPDHRRRYVRLTMEGKKALRKALAAYVQAERQFLQLIPKPQRDPFLATLRQAISAAEARAV